MLTLYYNRSTIARVRTKMYRSMYSKRSLIPGIWIAITTLALFVVVGSVSFDNAKNVYAAKDLNVRISVDDDQIEKGNTQKITVTVTEDGNSNDRDLWS